MEISSSGIISGQAFAANNARRDTAAQREAPRQEPSPSGTAPLPAATAELRETLYRQATTAGSGAERAPPDLPRSSRDALAAYHRQEVSLEQESLQAVYNLAGFDQYV